MNNLERLQMWYASQCDGEWEQHHGITIESLDNPGWGMKIDLKGTPIEGKSFQTVTKNLTDAGQPEDKEWMKCFVKEGQFKGAGDFLRLDDMLATFLDWAESR